MKEKRILIVEDDAVSATMAKTMLRKHGFSVCAIYSTGEECLAEIGSPLPDLILMDIVLPGDMDGVDTAVIIQQKYNIPIIFITGKTSRNTLKRVYKTNPYGYIQKPVEEQGLIITINTSLLRHRAENSIRVNEEELRKTTRRLEDIIDFLPDATFAINKEGTIIAWNRALEKMVGVQKDDMIGKGNYEYAIPFYGERRPILIDCAAGNHTHWLDSYDKHWKMGETVFAEAHIEKLTYVPRGIFMWIKATPLHDSTGEIIGAIETVRDITDIKMTEQSLRESEDKFRLLFEKSADAQLLLDDGLFIDCNTAAVNLLRASGKNQITGKTPDELSPHLQPDGMTSAAKKNLILTKAFEDGIIHFQWVHRTFDNRDIYVDVTLTLIPLSGRKILHTALRDITEKKIIEKEVLEISMKEQQRIGRDLHDGLGQVLTGTGFLCDSLIKKLSGTSSPVENEARRIKELISQAKEHTRMMARGLAPVDIDSGGLYPALTRLASDFEKVYPVFCEVNFDENVTLKNQLKETHLYYIVQESLLNAVKHGQPDKIVVDIQKSGHNITIAVHDNGTGIPDTAHRADGMGLHLMKYRASILGAELIISRHPGGGTLVRCSFMDKSPDG